jgi:isoquinoline 1-oxidoreductase beta subunit
MNVVKVNRRDFVKLTSAASAGLVLALQLPRTARGETKSEPYPLGTFVHVGTDGVITVYVSKSEMGQGVRTALPMIVAEEMDADWKKVRIRQADLDKKYGRMGTGGSSSVRTMWTPLRQAGATARVMLVSAAAAKWGVDPKDITVTNGVIKHGPHKATFGEFAAAAAKLEVPKDVTLKDPSKFTIIGKKTARVDDPDLMRGKGNYGIDVRLPGMLYGAVLRSPVFGGKVASFDDAKAKAIPGVKAIVKIDAHGVEAPWAGVGVVADSTWTAMKARDALEVKWDEGDAKNESTASLMNEMRDLVTKEGKRVRNEGDVDAALSSASKKLEATYELPYLAHATMEPMNATASVTADGIEVWGPTQFPDWWGGAAAGAVGLKPEQAKVHVTLLGGGFGRRAFPDVAVEAALLSKAVGAPVKVQWTRGDDMQHDFYRPATVHHLIAALDDKGTIAAWHHRMSSPAINTYMGRGEPHDSEVFDDEQLPLTIPNIRVEYASAKSFVPRGWWRSVENSSNAFVVQSFMDELAQVAGRDPIEFQLAMLPAGKKLERKGNNAPYPFEADRLRRVIELARDKSNWGKPLPKGRARGFAAWYSFLTYVAEIAEVSVGTDGTPRVHRVVTAIDCGTPVNPDGIAAQMEGGIVYGLTAALSGAITIKNGAVEQSNFHDYPLLTIAQMPVVEVHIVPSTALPTGTGEPGLPPAAPAVANAIFALTGRRLRKLPFGTV